MKTSNFLYLPGCNNYFVAAFVAARNFDRSDCSSAAVAAVVDCDVDLVAYVTVVERTYFVVDISECDVVALDRIVL